MTVTARISRGGNGRFRIRDATGVTTLPFGTVNLGQQYVTASMNYPNSTIMMLGNAVTVVLGAPAGTSAIHVTTASTAQWTASNAAYDAAGNACTANTVNASGSPKVYF